MRRAAHLTAACVAAALLSACGQQGVTSQKHPAGAARDQGTWLLRLDSYSGEDGETKQATYLTLTPETGHVLTVTTPRLKVAESSGLERVLLVDANRKWALLDSRPTRADRAAGQVTLYDLTQQGATRTVDVRKATGDAKLTPDWVAFDVRKPDVLRVVDGLTVWVVAADGRTATREGVLPTRPGWIFNGGFDKNSGLPYIEDTSSFATLPRGNGETDRRPVVRDGGRVVPSDNGRFPGLPEARCGLGAAFRVSDGDTWAFCVNGTRLRTRMIARGAADWKDSGTPTSDVVAPNAEPTFVLPGS